MDDAPKQSPSFRVLDRSSVLGAQKRRYANVEVFDYEQRWSYL